MKIPLKRKIAFNVPTASYGRIIEIFNKNNIEIYSILPETLDNADRNNGYAGSGLSLLTEESVKKLPNPLFFNPDDLSKSIAVLKDINPDFILYGSEFLIEIGDMLANEVCPQFSNPLSSSLCRMNKHAVNTVLAKNGFRTAKEIVINQWDDSLLNDLHYPIVIKPCEISGLGFGVRQCLNQQDIINYFAENNLQCIIQETIWDRESEDLQISYSVDGFALDHEFSFISLQKWYKKRVNGKFECFYAEQLDPTSEFSQNIFNETCKILKVLELNNGFFHPELMRDGKNLVLIDLNPRICGGNGIIDKMIEFSCGNGIIQYFINKVYNQEDIQPTLMTDSRLIFLYDLTDKEFEQIQTLPSFRDYTPFDILKCKIVLLGNSDNSNLERDFDYCASLNKWID